MLDSEITTANIIIIFFGYFENTDLSYLQALSVEYPALAAKIHLLGWKSQQSQLHLISSNYKVDLLDDPGSIVDLNHRLVNINRQLTHWHHLLDLYPSHTILKLRPDTRFSNLKQLFKTLRSYDRSVDNQVWLLNSTSSSPRILNLVQLPNHYCDWLVLGHTQAIRKLIRTSLLDEAQLLNCKHKRQGLVLRARTQQSEQLLFDKTHLSSFKILTAKSFGLAFSKYPQSFKRNFSPYALISMNGIECLLYNRRKVLLLKLYPPVLRILFYLLFLFRSLLTSKPFLISI